MKHMRKAVYAGASGALLAVAAAFANAVPQITTDEWWIIGAAALSGLATGVVAYYAKNVDEDTDEGEMTASSLAPPLPPPRSGTTTSGPGHIHFTWVHPSER